VGVVFPLRGLPWIGALVLSPLLLPYFPCSSCHALRSIVFLLVVLWLLAVHSMHAHFAHADGLRVPVLLGCYIHSSIPRRWVPGKHFFPFSAV
jgi:hypothetical protein